MAFTIVQAKVTKTAAFNGASVDISAIPGDWTLVLNVQKMTDGATARFNFADSVDAFTAKIAGPSVSLTGKVDPVNPRRFSFTKKDFPSLRFNAANAVLRLELAELTGSAPSIDYEAWLEV